MAFASVRITGRDNRLEDDEIALGEPDEAEAHSLPLHVEKDTKRYRVMMRRLYKLTNGNQLNTLLLGAILVWLVLTSPQFRAAMTSVGLIH